MCPPPLVRRVGAGQSVLVACRRGGSRVELALVLGSRLALVLGSRLALVLGSRLALVLGSRLALGLRCVRVCQRLELF
jgi:hypothetical protein